MTPPIGLAQILATFGDPKYDGHGGVSPAWEDAHMVLVRDLPLIPKLYCNRVIVEPLRAALTACAELGDGYHLGTIGCFAPRAKRGTEGLSVHTWGAAVDINPDCNRLIVCELDDPRRTAPGARDIPDAWITAFKAAGFVWGGDFRHRFDPMHFQWCAGY